MLARATSAASRNAAAAAAAAADMIAPPLASAARGGGGGVGGIIAAMPRRRATVAATVDSAVGPAVTFAHHRIRGLIRTHGGGDAGDATCHGSCEEPSVAARRVRRHALGAGSGRLAPLSTSASGARPPTSPSASSPPSPSAASSSSGREERELLLAEARRLTTSFYRTCLRSVRLLRAGNDRDFREFDRRERELLDEFGSTEGGKRINFDQVPFVDRKDELRSRADYYADWTLENVVQESDCLVADPWIGESDVKRYLYHLRNGEERRRFIIKDYGFDDPYGERFDRERVEVWERRAMVLVDETYRERGWERPRSHAAGAHVDIEDDEDWGDDD